VRNRIHVVSIGLDAEEDPYEIFESLNGKTEPLTPADFVRNYVMMRFRHAIEPGGEQQQIYDWYWKPIEDLLANYLTSFLRHYHMKDGKDVRESGVYAAAKERFSKAKTPVDVRAELADLRRHAGYYKCFLDPTLETRIVIADRLRALSRVDVSTCYPLLLNGFAFADELRVSEDELGDVLKIIESFVFRRMICGIPANLLGRIFLQLARELEVDPPSSRIAKWLQNKLLAGSVNRRWPTDEEVTTACKTQPQYGRKSTSPVLIRLEESYGHKEPVDLTSVTIEHIMPQTLTEGWQTMLGETWKQDYNELCHNLGNLTLTAYNSEAGQEWEQKRSVYAESNVVMTKRLAVEPDWTAHKIRTRANRLAEEICKLYPRPASREDSAAQAPHLPN
jgi:Protein of unknown function (DUF1524)